MMRRTKRYPFTSRGWSLGRPNAEQHILVYDKRIRHGGEDRGGRSSTPEGELPCKRTLLPRLTRQSVSGCPVILEGGWCSLGMPGIQVPLTSNPVVAGWNIDPERVSRCQAYVAPHRPRFGPAVFRLRSRRLMRACCLASEKGFDVLVIWAVYLMAVWSEILNGLQQFEGWSRCFRSGRSCEHANKGGAAGRSRSG